MIMIVNGEWEQNLCVFPYDGGKISIHKPSMMNGSLA